MSKEEKKDIKWYESGNAITSIIIGIIIVTIVCSQSFAVVGKNNSLSIFSSVINHNSIYLLVLIYFVVLKTKWGKRYFNYLNVFLMIIYFLATVTSLLTLIQSFSLNTILAFLVNLVLIIYLFHTMFRDTLVWKDLKLGNSPFNELSNDSYYYTLFVLVVISLVVNLISTVVVSGLFVSILDALYILLLGRYIYLYREYLDYNKIDSDNKGNFDEIRENISNDLKEVRETIEDVSDSIQEKTSELLDSTEIDKSVTNTVIKIKNTTKEKINEVLDKTDIDEKIVDATKRAKSTVKDKVTAVSKKSSDKDNTKVKKSSSKGEDK